jgi:hypothetical protein
VCRIVDVLMPATQLRAGDVFSVPGVSVRGPYRVLRALLVRGVVTLRVCDPDEETAYPLTAQQLQAAGCCALQVDAMVRVHARDRY